MLCWLSPLPSNSILAQALGVLDCVLWRGGGAQVGTSICTQVSAHHGCTVTGSFQVSEVPARGPQTWSCKFKLTLSLWRCFMSGYFITELGQVSATPRSTVTSRTVSRFYQKFLVRELRDKATLVENHVLPGLDIFVSSAHFKL